MIYKELFLTSQSAELIPFTIFRPGRSLRPCQVSSMHWQGDDLDDLGRHDGDGQWPSSSKWLMVLPPGPKLKTRLMEVQPDGYPHLEVWCGGPPV